MGKLDRLARRCVVICLFGFSVCLLIGSFSIPAHADEPSAITDESEILFVRRIAPLFREKCLGCHGQDPELIEGNLDFRSIHPLTAGGESGEAGIVVGNPEESSIYLASLRGEEDFSAMPPKESEALSDQQLSWLKRWIETGAKWPTEETVKAIEQQYAEAWSAEDGVIVATSGGLDANWTNRRYDPAGLWAYQPLKHAEIPPGQKSPIDHFILDTMPDGLAVAPRADRRTLIRRAAFDLTGLPPTPEQVANFLDDPADDQVAFAALVDRLLDSPHYGERMAQHWLDVTRYADSSGFANDYERGNAWRYRDYVIRSFNDDKPYNDFIREQIAGDEITPDDPEGIIAAGFLRMGPWELTGMEVAKVARMRFLDDVTNSVGETFLGQSLQCCRCHDHKFDPIPTRDYYSVQAIFATTQLADRQAKFTSDENIAGFEERTYLEARSKGYENVREQMDKALLENAEQWYAAENRDMEQWKEAVAKAKQGKTARGVFVAARKSLMASGIKQQDLPPIKVGFTPQQFGLERVARKGLERLKWEFDRYQPFAHSVYNGHTPSLKSVPNPLRLPKDRTKGELETPVIHTGGDPFAEGEPVQPGVLSVITNQVSTEVPKTISGRRTALANWIADSANPLTTRVIVNRIWQWHFGQAIAGNPNNFGSTGKRPTHPLLLDFLAQQLIAGDWSIKSLHRQIMNSDAYCRSSHHPDRKQLSNLDPQNESYAAFMPRRLSAEELRDAMLSVSVQLNDAIGGIPCRPIINAEVALQPRQVMGTFAAAWTPNPKPAQRNRRSIYVLKLRGLVDPSLEVFNAPSPDFSCERRDTSTVTPQVFTMFNSHSTHTRALALAKDVMTDNADPSEVIRRVYSRLFSRDATDREITRCLAHWNQIETMLPSEAPNREPPPRQIVREAVEENTGERFTFIERLHAVDDFEPDVQPSDVSRRTRALADLCLVLLNSNEFVYVY
ncbi:Planctomycete cytochrome C [Roseimaritima multifibrata]|uniref:Planctomycete cytochrome C n=1 Tax=Roseimaritima multifibrata TaxID=1930274 RepID=A0A517MI67_9BACT|nr:PSD1 and planctomycete cytochrome C domain-containing protein [Roseimaritima multifibrata]QDS94564.1 Planctomycete cytochrome C [Roseimaritima multifibrata]